MVQDEGKQEEDVELSQRSLKFLDGTYAKEAI